MPRVLRRGSALVTTPATRPSARTTGRPAGAGRPPGPPSTTRVGCPRFAILATDSWPEEAALGPVDHRLDVEPGLGRQRVRVEVDREPGDAARGSARPRRPRRPRPGDRRSSPRAPPRARRPPETQVGAVPEHEGAPRAGPPGPGREARAVGAGDIGREEVRAAGRRSRRLARRLREQELVAAERPQHVEVARILPVGREQERAAAPAPGRGTRRRGGDEVVEPPRGVRRPRPASGAASASSTNAAPSLERARTARSKVARVHVCEDRRAVDVPRTLVVTNDYPPRVGGIQRTLEALVRQLPARPGRGAVPRVGGRRRASTRPPRTASSASPSGSCGRRRTSGRRDPRGGPEFGAEVVLFGATYPLALLGPALAEARDAVPVGGARVRVLAVDRARGARARAAARRRGRRACR